ncbi:mannose/cellobiose epimerase-like protein (N-acyl-D-glucosamine 2-epimerase family) [Bradyrhizobium japonicum]
MITSITTKSVAAALVTKALTTGWDLDDAGARWGARLDNLPLWAPAILWKLCARVRMAGEALSAFAERVAPRLGVDMDADVLEPMLDRVRCA